MGDLHTHNGMPPDAVRFVVMTSAAAYCPWAIQ
jgi:hypothetical protein